MATDSPAPVTASPPAAPKGPSLRILGGLVFVMFLLTSVVGGSLALESTYLVVTLASHIGLALVTLAVAGYTASVVGRRYRTLPRVSAGLGALSALGATLAGTAFLLGGQSPVALNAMAGLAGLGLLTGLLMIVFGGPSGRIAPGPAASG